MHPARHLDREGNLMRYALRICLAVAAVGGIAADAAPARPLLSKPQYIARADVICGRAIQQTHAIGVVPSVAAWGGTAGARLLSIDRTALAALKVLAPPSTDTTTLHRLLAGASATVAETARGIGAAHAGNAGSFRAHAAKVAVLTRRYQAGARAYGFRVCSRWGS
jgi:hypothetical protein